MPLKKFENYKTLKKKKKKKNFFLYRPVLPEIGRYGRYKTGTAGIFSGTKQEGRVYRIAGRYGIFRPYRPVRYGIDNLAFALFIISALIILYVIHNFKYFLENSLLFM